MGRVLLTCQSGWRGETSKSAKFELISQSHTSNPTPSPHRSIHHPALRYNLAIRAQHRPGVDNVLADFLSRPELHQHDHVARWAATHPAASACLSAVSVVYSKHYVRSSIARRLLAPTQHTPRVRVVSAHVPRHLCFITDRIRLSAH